MAAPSHRRQQIGHLLRDAIIEVLGELKNTWVQLATVTEVVLEPDGHSAQVYFTAQCAPGQLPEVEEALNSAAGYIRKLVTEALSLRVVPSLQFVRDEQAEQAARLEVLLRQIGSGEAAHGDR